MIFEGVEQIVDVPVLQIEAPTTDVVKVTLHHTGSRPLLATLGRTKTAQYRRSFSTSLCWRHHGGTKVVPGLDAVPTGGLSAPNGCGAH